MNTKCRKPKAKVTTWSDWFKAPVVNGMYLNTCKLHNQVWCIACRLQVTPAYFHLKQKPDLANQYCSVCLWAKHGGHDLKAHDQLGIPVETVDGIKVAVAWTDLFKKAPGTDWIARCKQHNISYCKLCKVKVTPGYYVLNPTVKMTYCSICLSEDHVSCKVVTHDLAGIPVLK